MPPAPLCRRRQDPGNRPSISGCPQAVLVTGGAGYIGAHACKALARAGYRPVVFDNLSRGHRQAVRWGPLVEGELADRQRLRAAIEQYQVAAVMHFAAYAYVGESVADPALYYRNNLVGSLSLFEAMRESGIGRIVFSSTCATYGIPDSVPIKETARQSPINPYGETKLAIERALLWYGEAYGVRSVSLRYFNAAGADPEGEIGECHAPETHLVPLALQAALGIGPPLEVYGTDYPTPDGTAIRDYIHVADLAAAHLLALEHLLEGQRQRCAQPRHRPRPFGARGDRRRRDRGRQGGPKARGGAASRRSGDARRRSGAGRRSARLASADIGSQDDHRKRVRLARQPARGDPVARAARRELGSSRQRPRRKAAPRSEGNAVTMLVGDEVAAPPVVPPPAAAAEPIRVYGKFFFAGERKHFVKGRDLWPVSVRQPRRAVPRARRGRRRFRR